MLRWTEKENEYVMEGKKRFGTNWGKIREELFKETRTAEAIKRRYYHILAKNKPE